MLVSFHTCHFCRHNPNKMCEEVADLSIADVSIVLQQGVWVGVIQHGPSGVISSTVCDPVGKQHIVKLHAKPSLFSPTASCN